MDFNQIEKLVGLLAAVAAAILIWWQIADAARSNRLRSTHHTLSEVVSGRFGDLLKDMSVKHGWDIVRTRVTYRQIADGLTDSPGRLTELIADLQIILRILEAVCISVEHGIIKEDVCREYLTDIIRSIYANCSEFIEKERQIRGEPGVYIMFEKYARRWASKRRKTGR